MASVNSRSSCDWLTISANQYRMCYQQSQRCFLFHVKQPHPCLMPLYFSLIPFKILFGFYGMKEASVHLPFLNTQATNLSAQTRMFTACLYKRNFKGALDKYDIIPNFFQKKVGIFVPLDVLAWVMVVCQVLHSRLTYFWRNMIISDIFYFPKSTSINIQNSIAYGAHWRWCYLQNTSQNENASAESAENFGNGLIQNPL